MARVCVLCRGQCCAPAPVGTRFHLGPPRNLQFSQDARRATFFFYYTLCAAHNRRGSAGREYRAHARGFRCGAGVTMGRRSWNGSGIGGPGEVVDVWIMAEWEA